MSEPSAFRRGQELLRPVDGCSEGTHAALVGRENSYDPCRNSHAHTNSDQSQLRCSGDWTSLPCRFQAERSPDFGEDKVDDGMLAMQACFFIEECRVN